MINFDMMINDDMLGKGLFDFNEHVTSVDLYKGNEWEATLYLDLPFVIFCACIFW